MATMEYFVISKPEQTSVIYEVGCAGSFFRLVPLKERLCADGEEFVIIFGGVATRTPGGT